MKILMTGGGSGGHFYPLIAVAEALRDVAQKEKLVGLNIYYMSDSPYDKEALFQNQIDFVKINSGKLRRYFSILNITDTLKTIKGIVLTLFKMFKIFPDVVFSKGGYLSFPPIICARLLGIPVMIHESDASVGIVNKFSASFAKKIAVSWSDTAKFFPADKVAHTGNPIRSEIMLPIKEGSFEFLKLDPNIPTILILGGSSGAKRINETILDALDKLVLKYQIIHQTGSKDFDNVIETSKIVLENNPYKERYRPLAFLNSLALRMAVGASSLIISRAGSVIFEIASWELPSIIIPIPEEISHDQRKNAFSYARTGSCIVLEENNLSPNILINEVNRLFESPKLLDEMRINAKQFAKKDAALKIARELIKIALSHEER